MIFAFLRDAANFMTASSRNVMAIHCKAGKGRTGTLCCAWLLYSREANSAKEALEMFAERRTDHIKTKRTKRKMIAVDTWGQVQCIHSLHAWLEAQGRYLGDSSFPSVPPAVPTKIRRVALRNLLHLPEGMTLAMWTDEDWELECEIRCPAWEAGPGPVVGFSKATVLDDEISFAFDGVYVQGDFRVDVYAARMRERRASILPERRFKAGKEPGLLFYMFEHTAFLAETGAVTFARHELGDTKLMAKLMRKGSSGNISMHYDKLTHMLSDTERDNVQKINLAAFMKSRKRHAEEVQERLDQHEKDKRARRRMKRKKFMTRLHLDHLRAESESSTTSHNPVLTGGPKTNLSDFESMFLEEGMSLSHVRRSSRDFAM